MRSCNTTCCLLWLRGLWGNVDKPEPLVQAQRKAVVHTAQDALTLGQAVADELLAGGAMA